MAKDCGGNTYRPCTQKNPGDKAFRNLTAGSPDKTPKPSKLEAYMNALKAVKKK